MFRDTASNPTIHVRPRLVAVFLALGLLLGGMDAGAAAVSMEDPRVVASDPSCLGSYVRAEQPYVYGNRPSAETIYWYPILQKARYTGWSWVWDTVDDSAPYQTFRATNQGSYSPLPYANPIRQFNFYNVTTGYYRVVHIVYWGSTGEFGSRTSRYCTN
jgi:hypothetical protein